MTWLTRPPSYNTCCVCVCTHVHAHMHTSGVRPICGTALTEFCQAWLTNNTTIGFVVDVVDGMEFEANVLIWEATVVVAAPSCADLRPSDNRVFIQLLYHTCGRSRDSELSYDCFFCVYQPVSRSSCSILLLWNCSCPALRCREFMVHLLCAFLHRWIGIGIGYM